MSFSLFSNSRCVVMLVIIDCPIYCIRSDDKFPALFGMKSCAKGPVVKTVVMCPSSPNYPYNSLKLTRRIKYLMLSTKITLLR